MSFKNLITTFSNQAKWVRITTYVITAYLIYALILGLITPLVLQSQLPGVLSDKLGRTVSIEKVRINPFLLRVRVSDFIVEEEQTNAPFVQVSLLEVDVGFWQTLLHLTPTIEHAYIDEPYTHLARISGGDKTTLNFSDIIEKLKQESSEQPPVDEDEITKIPHIRLGRFQLSGGHVLLSDHVTDTEINYPELAFELTDLDTLALISQPSKDKSAQLPENHYEFKLLSDEGGTLHFDGQFQLAPLEAKGSIELASVALSPLWPLSDDVIEARLTNGLLDFNLNYHLVQHVDGVRLQVNNGQLALSNLTITDSNSQPKVKIAGIHITGVKLDTNTQQVDIASVRIDEPWVDASVDKMGVDLVAILTPQSKLDPVTASAPNVKSAANSDAVSRTESQNAQTEQADPNAGTSVQDEADEPEWRVVLQSFALNNGDIAINERVVSQGVHWRVFNINATTGVVDTHFESPIEYTLQLGVGGNATQLPTSSLGEFVSSGKVNVTQQQVAGTVDVSQFALVQLQPYITPYLNADLQNGIAGVSGSFAAGSASPTVFTGQANISELAVVDGLKQEPLLKWQDMQLAGVQYDTGENAFSLQKITLKSPYAKLVIDKNRQTNISDIIVKTPSASAPPIQPSAAVNSPTMTEQAASPMAIRIDDISVLEGSAYFEDNSLRPRFASGIEALNGSITSLSSKADTSANVDLNGKIDGYAPVALSGAINPLLDDMYLNLNFSVSGAELTSVNPYSGTYMGHFIDKGLLSLDVGYKLENNQLKGQNHVVIDQLTLGRKTDSEQALSLPFGLAIALLQDSDGVIDLGMEVSGDLNNPSFGFGAIIFKALGNIITKAVTAPFSLLANLVGSDDELNDIAFSHGSAALNDAISEKLNTLAKALVKRPGLRVNIEGTVNEVQDAYEIAEQQLQQQLLELTGDAVLPADFSASAITLTGPYGNALVTLFSVATNKVVEEERQVVNAQLEQGQPEQKDGKRLISQDQQNQALVIAMYNQVRNSIKVPRHALAILAESRAKAVKTFLVNNAKVDTNRLFLLNSREHLQRDKSGVTLTLEAN